MSAKKFYQTPTFKQRDKEWDKILKDSGFSDIEETVGGTRYLRQRAASSYQRLIKQGKHTRAEYFSLISDNLHKTKFPRSLDEFVMTRFSEGLTKIAIAKEAKAIGMSIHRLTVAFIIRRYEHIWGLRLWTAKKRNLKSG